MVNKNNNITKSIVISYIIYLIYLAVICTIFLGGEKKIKEKIKDIFNKFRSLKSKK